MAAIFASTQADPQLKPGSMGQFVWINRGGKEPQRQITDPSTPSVPPCVANALPLIPLLFHGLFSSRHTNKEEHSPSDIGYKRRISMFEAVDLLYGFVA